MRKMASVLSSPLSVDSFMTAGWLNHHMPYKSYQRESHGKQKQSTLRIGALKRKRESEGGREGAFGCHLNAKSGHIFFFSYVFMN